MQTFMSSLSFYVHQEDFAKTVISICGQVFVIDVTHFYLYKNRLNQIQVNFLN